MNIEKQKFPIGKCQYQEDYSENEIKQFIAEIESFPKRLEDLVSNLNESQLQLTYRENGWIVKQVIHHCADSHMNCLIRIKLAMTEENPTIKPYEEDKWAEMVDYNLPILNSITILKSVHLKIVTILNSLSTNDLNRTYYHKEYDRIFRIKDVICLYAWHGNHHLAHISNALNSIK